MPLPSSNEKVSFATLMQRGSQLHADGEPELALTAFESASALRPDDTDAASARATLLLALSRPIAAYRVLEAAKKSLWDHADGAANLAIAAENCGRLDEAKSAYQRALTLDPNHIRSLNNVALIAASASNWTTAIDLARRCVALAPDDASYRQNLSDYLAGARRYPEALDVLEDAAKRFPDYLDITVRRIIVLAFNGDFEKSRQLAATLDAEEQAHFMAFVARSLASTGETAAVDKPAARKRDAFELYTWQAFDAMKRCDWRGNENLTANLRAVLAGSIDPGKTVDWLAVEFYTQTLDLSKEELVGLQGLKAQRLAPSATQEIPEFTITRKTVLREKDQRIHVGLAVHCLHDAQNLHALKQQLELHDKSRFAVHVYSTTQQPAMDQVLALQSHTESVVQISHMSDPEVAARIRLDQLDLFIDMLSEPGIARSNIAYMRVAPVQICNSTWQSHSPSGPFEYSMSDPFVHKDAENSAALNALARLPVTCWLALQDGEYPLNPPSRQAIGLPPDAFVLCAIFEPSKLGPAAFALWTDILKSLPAAVLLLPGCDAAVQANLLAEALAAGVPVSQVVFSVAVNRADLLASIQNADLFLDALRFSSARSVEDALRMGVPAISCSGSTTASRLGGSLLRAAGFAECVFETPQAYAAEIIRLGRNPAVLMALRERFSAARYSAPLFDVATRVKELETAWTTMVDRSRAGLPPATFNTADFKLS